LFSGPSKAPIQAQAGEVHLGLLESAGPARVTFREFGPLFDAEGFRLDVSGAIGTDQRAGGEVSASGLHQGFSIAAGQFYFEDDGVRANSDQREVISAARVRLAPNSAVSLMGEFSFRDSETGDLTEDLIDGISDQRVEQQDRRGRLGIKVSPTAEIDLYALYTFRDRSVDQAIPSADGLLSALDEDGHQVQVRGDFRPRDDLVFVIGGEAGRANTSTAASILLPIFPGFLIRTPISDFDTDTRQATGYAYAYWMATDWMKITGGLAFNHYNEDPDGPGALKISRVSPKLGVEIRPIPEVTLRAAAFRSVKHRLVFDQTLEPTQIAGFNQTFQDFNGTESTTFGLGADWHPLPWLWLGGEATWRELEQPVFFDAGLATASIGSFDGSADTVRGYIGATLGPQVAVSVGAEHTVLKLSRGAGFSDDLSTVLAPASVRWFHPIGVFASAEAVYYNQDLTRTSAAIGQSSGDTDGVVVNLAGGYRLPDQRGVLSIEVLNLLDKDVEFQEPSYRVGDVGTRQLARGLTVTVRGTFVARQSG
jgi:hypothetical protein